MNQLLIALLISTSLAGVIQGGFFSSSINDQNQGIERDSKAEVSQVVKDDLTDFIYIGKPEEKTSSKIVQFEIEDESSLCASGPISVKEIKAQSSSKATVEKTKKVEMVELQTNADEVTQVKTDTEKAEKVQENKDIDRPAAEETEEVKETNVKHDDEEKNKDTETISTPAVEEENKDTETTSTPVVELEESINSSTEKPEQEGKVLTVTATAYTADCEGGTGVTYTGIDLKANPDQKVIAVDPSVIPLGTEVYVEGYGRAIAADIGGAIKGNKIDVFIPSQAEAEDWGIKTVTVEILEN